MGYKHDYDKALTRLVNILKRLYDGDVLSVKELAEEFNCSSRTIQRDFNDRLYSFPIMQQDKKWKMQDGFHIEKIASLEDQLILNILEKLSENIGTIFSTKAKKLLSKMKNVDTSPIYAKLDIEDIGDKIHIINTLESAIKEHHLITCKYKKDETMLDLNLKPLKITNFEGFWYLIALDASNDVLKKYHLKSVSSVATTKETFVRSKALDETLDNAINIWFQIDNEPFEVILRANSEIAKYFQRKPISKSQRIVSVSVDGSMDISLKITHPMEIRSLVFYWMPNLTVLEPQSLVEEIKEIVKEYSTIISE